MADTNTYTSKQNIKKYTTQAKFDAIDKSDVPVGTEYNIVGSVTESDLDSDLQAKVNLTGDGLTTEITGGKVKVKNPMTSTVGNGFKLNSFYNATTGVTYFFPIETPIGHFATGIVPIIGSITRTTSGSTAPATYQGVLLPNAYSENNYGPNAYAMLTMSESRNSGNQIYILPYCSSNQGVSRLLSTESLEAGPGITIQNASTPGRLKISADGGGGGLPDIPDVTSHYSLHAASGVAQWVLTDYSQAGELTRRWVRSELPSSPSGRVSLFRGWNADADDGSGSSAYIVLLPTSNSTNVTVTLPAKSGTLATLDDIPTGGGTTYTAGKNIAIDGTTIKTKDDVTFDTAVVNALTVATTGIFTRGPINRVPNINFGTSAEPLSTTGLYSFCTVFTTTGNENKTTYGFKIPPVGGVADIRFPNITYGNLVAQEQLKTIFGNQSLVGGGNIDLYKHQIAISGENNAGYTAGSSCWIEFYSSNNLNADSLTDIKTLLGNVFLIEIKGACFINADDTKYYRALYMTETSIYMEDNNFTGLTISVAGFTFTDYVTTI